MAKESGRKMGDVARLALAGAAGLGVGFAAGWGYRHYQAGGFASTTPRIVAPTAAEQLPGLPPNSVAAGEPNAMDAENARLDAAAASSGGASTASSAALMGVGGFGMPGAVYAPSLPRALALARR